MTDQTEDAPGKVDRPLSPHLQVYKLPLTANLSILHRITGVALCYGLAMVVWWLLAAATSAEAYQTFMDFSGSPLGLFMLFGWSVALFYHSCNGIRHLFWDMGYGFKIKQAFASGYVVLILAVLLTGFVWCTSYF